MKHRITATGKRLQLARKNGRAGGKSWAKKAAQPGSSSYGGGTMLEERAERMTERQKEIYGAIFANRVRRNPRGVQKGTIRGSYQKKIKHES
jgi:hypothetical protein